MGVSVLTPALPTFAAENKTINFDLGIYATFEGKSLRSLSGTGGQNVKAAYSTLPVDTDKNGQSATSVTPDTNLEMPWWGTDWTTFNTAPNGNKPEKPGTTTPVTWNGETFNFPGYSFAGWYAEDYRTNTAQKAINKLPKEFPYRDITYYARYITDGTQYKFTVEHKSDANHHAPIPENTEGNNVITEETQSYVLINRQARPKVIPGYKAVLKDSNIKIYEPGTTNPVEGKTYTNYNFAKAPDDENAVNATLTGEMINKDIKVTYEYSPDTDKTFTVVSEHNILGSNGAVLTTVVKRNAFHAEQDITGVGPDASLITAANGAQARYILVTTDGDTTGLASGASTEHVKAPSIESGTTAEPARYIARFEGSLNASTHALEGQMPNRGFSVSYTYVPNPDYHLAVTVRYVDPDGNELTRDVVAAASVDKTVTADNAIVYEANPDATVNIPLPDLSNLGYGEPIQNFVGEFAGSVKHYAAGASTGTLDLTLTDAPVDVTVTYPKNPTRWAKILFALDGGGKLVNHYENAGGANDYNDANNPEYDNSQADAVSLLKNADGSITLTQDILDDIFPIPVSDLGYKIEGFYEGSVAEGNRISNGTTLARTSIAPASSVTIHANFKKNSNWKDISFRFEGGNGSMSPSASTIQIYPYDAAGNARTIEWLEMNPDTARIEYFGLVPTASADSNYRIDWYLPNGSTLADRTDMAALEDGVVITARAVSTLPLVLGTPTLEGAINDTDGIPYIKLGALNNDVRVKYAITDESGIVLKVISNIDLQRANGIINDDILPDTTYKAYEVDSEESVNVGNNIADVAAKGAPAVGRTPVILPPVVSIDPADPDKNVAEFRPVTPGMDYAIIDENGDVVTGWITPDSNTLVVPGLDPDKPYTVVVKPTADPSAPTDRLPGQEIETVARSNQNQLIFVNSGDISVLSPTDLHHGNVPAGTVVTIQARPLNDAGELFTGRWDVLMGTPLNVSTDGNTQYQFTMPNSNVIIRAVYNGDATWHTATSSDAVGDNRSIGVVNPALPAGDYRISIDRQALSASELAAIDAQEADTYTGLWKLIVKVEKLVAGVWTDYVDPNLKLNTYIDTGLLRENQDYMLYEIATGSNASKVSGAYESVINDPDYTGSFSYEFDNGKAYAFGYIRPLYYRVTVKDGRTNSLITTLSVGARETVSDHSARYASSIVPAPYIDVNGITWTYVGLSSDRDSYVAFDDTLALTSDQTIWLYYESDRVDRAAERQELSDLIDSAQARPVRERAQIQNAIDHAVAVIRQTAPRKASTAELEAARALLDRAIRGITSGGSGSGGSGGSGGSSGGRINTNPGTTTNNAPTNAGVAGYTNYSVGTHGNWSLIDAANHKWIFVLSSGERLTGWANLSYYYNGITRVETYHFGADGIMDDGWFKDTDGNWYYLSQVHDGFFGKLIRGWHYDGNDHKWYYLRPTDGRMLLNWQQIAGVWYYLNPENNVAPTWRYNATTEKWEYITGNTIRPLGSMYENETTPDGYKVDASGAWIRE